MCAPYCLLEKWPGCQRGLFVGAGETEYAGLEVVPGNEVFDRIRIRFEE